MLLVATLLPPACNEMAAHSEPSTAGKPVEDNCTRDADLPRHVTEEQLRKVAPIPMWCEHTQIAGGIAK